MCVLFIRCVDSETVDEKNKKMNNEENFEHLPEEVKDLFQYITSYKPRVLRLSTPLKCFIPQYIPSIDHLQSHQTFVTIPRPDGINDNLGRVILDEPGSYQSNTTILLNDLNEIMNNNENDEKNEELIQSIDNTNQNLDSNIQEKQEKQVEENENENENLLNKNIIRTNSIPIQSVAENYVSNILRKSISDYENSPKSKNQSIINQNNSKQFVNDYIQNIFNSVISKIIISSSNSTIDPISSNESLILDTNKSLDYSIDPSSVTHSHPSPKSEPRFTEEEYNELKDSLELTYQQQIVSLKDNYELQLKELQQKYEQLTKSTQITISTQSKKLLTLNELLEEKNYENEILQQEIDTKQIECETHIKLINERFNMINEDFKEYVNVTNRKEIKYQKDIRLLKLELTNLNNQLNTTIEYYKEKERKAEEDALVALAAMPIMTEGVSQTDPDEIIVEYEALIHNLTQQNQIYEKGVNQHNELKEKYQKLEIECNELKKSLEQSQDAYHITTLKLNASNYEIELQNNETKGMRQELTELKQYLNNLIQEMHHIEANNNELKNKIAMDAESIHNMKASKQKLQKNITNLETENKLLHINYTALQSLKCQQCNRTISEIYNNFQQSQQQQQQLEQVQLPFEFDNVDSISNKELIPINNSRPSSQGKRLEKNIGESAFDNLPDEMSQSDEIQLTESRLMDESMKDMLHNNPRMMMNSSILLKPKDVVGSNHQYHYHSNSNNSSQLDHKSKSTNSFTRSKTHRDVNSQKLVRMNSPKLEAVILPLNCAECLKKIKSSEPIRLPIALQNLDLNSKESTSPLSNEFQELGFPTRKGYLDNQIVKHDLFGNKSGQKCVFCSWQCARVWNQKHTPIIQKYLIDQLICIAQGSF